MEKYLILGLVIVIVILVILLIKKNKVNDSLDKKFASTNGRTLKKYRDSEAGRELAKRRWNK